MEFIHDINSVRQEMQILHLHSQGLRCEKGILHSILYRTPSINAQCQSMPINSDQNPGIDPNAMILFGIDRHWALIEGVLTIHPAPKASIHFVSQ